MEPFAAGSKSFDPARKRRRSARAQTSQRESHSERAADIAVHAGHATHIAHPTGTAAERRGLVARAGRVHLEIGPSPARRRNTLQRVNDIFRTPEPSRFRLPGHAEWHLQ